MTINANTLIQEGTLNRMVQLAFRGQNHDPVLLDSALGVLKKCGFNEEQTAVIAAILRNVPSDNAVQATTAMKERILAVLNGEDIEINEALEGAPNGPQIVPMKQICYSEHPIEILDISEKIYQQCAAGGDLIGLQVLACTSVKLYENFTSFVRYLDLNLCPNLTILDAKTQGITIDVEPSINKLQILKCCKDIASQVENNEGLTLLTMAKGLTLNQLVTIAAEKEITVNFLGGDEFLQELGDVPVEQTYVILITNNVFMGSRNKNYALHKELVVRLGCGMPTVQEYVALCVFTNKCFQKCLYGRNGWTWGRSSTHFRDNPLVVGGYSQVPVAVFCSNVVAEDTGAGGRRKF